MASQSDEGDIWNYQPAVRKKRTAAVSESQAANCGKGTLQRQPLATSRRSLRDERNTVSATAPLKHNHQKLDGKADDSKSIKGQIQVIDIELEPDFDMPAKVLESSKQKNDSLCEASAKVHPCKLFVEKKPTAVGPSTQKGSRDKRSKPEPSKSKSKDSPLSKSRRTSLCKTVSQEEEKAMTSIKKYFSPTKSSSTAQQLFANCSLDLSDDDLIILDNDDNLSENKPSLFATESSTDTHKDNFREDGKSNDSSPSKTNVKIHCSTPEVHDAEQVQSYSCQNSAQNVQNKLQIPSVDVDVVLDEQLGSFFGTENRKPTSAVDESSVTVDMCPFSETFTPKRDSDTTPAGDIEGTIENKTVAGTLTSSSSSCKENDEKQSCLQSSQDKEKVLKDQRGGFFLEDYDLSDDSFNDKPYKPLCSTSSGDAEQGNVDQAVGFLFDKSDSSSDEPDWEKVELPKKDTKMSQQKEKQTGSHGQNIKSEQSTLNSAEQVQLDKDDTESGGFLMDDDILEKNLARNSTSSDLRDKPFGLSTSASCPNVPSSFTKQTDIFSFFKVRPGTGNKLIAAKQVSQTSLVKSKSGPSDLLFQHGGTKSQSGSSSSNWRNKMPSTSAGSKAWQDEKSQTNVNKKQCPFYKKMPGTSITVDAFRYGVIPGCEAYVLTHFHYDHYGGLTKKFTQPIFCSQITGNLVESRIGVDKRYINRLPMWKPCTVAGITLTLMEANHCPGAVIILFELKDGRKILHTGDFRANRDMEMYSTLQGIKISELYLDTTYGNPSYAFPDQTEVVHFVVDLVLKHISDHPSTLVVCGAYTIGKERIFTAIAKALDSKICVMNDKKKVLDCLEDADLKSRVTLDWSKGRVHVLPMGKLNQANLKEHLARHSHFKTILALQPTGWTHSDKKASLHHLAPKWSKDGITVYGVPYSEHSSFLEMKRFVQHFQPVKILPTVNNGNPTSRAKMEDIFKEWMQEKRTFAL